VGISSERESERQPSKKAKEKQMKRYYRNNMVKMKTRTLIKNVCILGRTA